MLGFYRWIPETIFLWFVIALMLACAFMHKIYEHRSDTTSQQSPFRWDLSTWVILGWLLIAGLYFLKTNVVPSRVVYTDEGSFWFVRAVDFVTLEPFARTYDDPYIKAYSLGIPFVCALPNLLLAVYGTYNLFYMPIILIVQIVCFLFALKKERWVFVFVMAAILMTISRHLWWQQLFLGLIYGEGISSVFMLVLICEYWRMKDKKNVAFGYYWALAFGTGLLVNLKAPSSLVYPSFFVIFLTLRRFNFKEALGIMCMLVTPTIIRMMHVSPSLSQVSEFVHFDFRAIAPMTQYLLTGYTSPIFFGVVSLVLIMVTFKKKEFFYLVPIACEFILIYWLYSTRYSSQEYESSGRYLMHGMLGLYFLGGIGCMRLMNALGKYIDSYRKKSLLR